MKAVLTAAMTLAIVLPSIAQAGYTCQTRKSGSVTITSCSGGKSAYTQCRSYRSGSVVKTSCR